MVKDHSRF